jgi:hypothetical protein
MTSALSISPATTPAPPAPRGVQYIDVTTAVKRSGLSKRQITRLCGDEWFARDVAKLEGKEWRIREDADVRFARIQFAENVPADLKGLTHANRSMVMARAAILRAWEDYTNRARAYGHRREVATACFLEELEAG